MGTINDETIELILSERFDEGKWFFELGRTEAIANNGLDAEHQFMNSFFDAGKRLWEFYKPWIREFLCNVSTNEPKEFVKELIDGDIRELITAIVTGLASTYSLALGIAIPLCALILKKQIVSICML